MGCRIGLECLVREGESFPFCESMAPMPYKEASVLR